MEVVRSERHFFVRQEAAKKIRDSELLKAHAGDRHIGQILVRVMTRTADMAYLQKLLAESRHLEVRKAAEAQLRMIRDQARPPRAKPDVMSRRLGRRVVRVDSQPLRESRPAPSRRCRTARTSSAIRFERSSGSSGIEGQAQHLAREPLRDRQVARLAPGRGHGRLQVDRPRVVDGGGDALRRRGAPGGRRARATRIV